MHVVAYRDEEVRLAESDASVDEQRVVGNGRRSLGDRHRCGVREPVRRSRHERVEGVVGEGQSGGAELARRPLLGRYVGGRSDPGIGRRASGIGRRIGREVVSQAFDDPEHDLNGATRRLPSRMSDELKIVVLQAFSHKVARDLQCEGVVDEPRRPHGGEPHRLGVLAERVRASALRTWDQTSRAAFSENACAMRIHRAFPHRWITPRGEVSIEAPVLGPVPAGRAAGR